jgi:hypothetical protein
MSAMASSDLWRRGSYGLHPPDPHSAPSPATIAHAPVRHVGGASSRRPPVIPPCSLAATCALLGSARSSRPNVHRAFLTRRHPRTPRIRAFTAPRDRTDAPRFEQSRSRNSLSHHRWLAPIARMRRSWGSGDPHRRPNVHRAFLTRRHARTARIRTFTAHCSRAATRVPLGSAHSFTAPPAVIAHCSLRATLGSARSPRRATARTHRASSRADRVIASPIIDRSRPPGE